MPPQGLTLNTSARPLLDTCLNLGSWPEALGQTDFFGNSDHIIADYHSAADLSACFANLNGANKRLWVESGVIKLPGIWGAAMFDHQKLHYIPDIQGNGGEIAAFVMDDPMADWKTKRQTQTREWAVEQIAVASNECEDMSND